MPIEHVLGHRRGQEVLALTGATGMRAPEAKDPLISCVRLTEAADAGSHRAHGYGFRGTPMGARFGSEPGLTAS